MDFDATEYCNDFFLPLRDKSTSGTNVSVAYNIDDPGSDSRVYYDDSDLKKIWNIIGLGFGLSISCFIMAICLVFCWKRS